MTVRAALRQAQSRIDPLDASVLLAALLGWPRERLYREPEASVAPGTLARYLEWTESRAQGLPVAYLTGIKEFYGRDFAVDRRVLIPRPDTEILVEAALEVFSSEVCPPPAGPGQAHLAAPRVLDVCTGSGCVGLTLALERPAWALTCADLSPEALEVARLNAQRLGARADFVPSDLLSALPGPWDLIVSNPPYLTPDETAACLAQGWQEPWMALDGGPDRGTDLPRRLINQALATLKPGAWLLFEAASAQAPIYTQAFAAGQPGSPWTEFRIWKDLAGLDRVFGARR